MNMKKTISLLCILALLFVFPTSCEEREGGDEGAFYNFTDSLGNKVSLDEPPKRVAVLFSSFADIWQTAGGTVSVTVGDAVEAGFAPESAVTVHSGSGHSGIDTERLLAAEPDLVIGTADYPSQVEACELMRSFGIPAASLRVDSFEDYLHVLRIFTDLTGKSERYELYGSGVAARIEELKGSFSVGSSCDILFLRATKSSHKALSSSGHFAAALVSDLGLSNIADKTDALYGTDLLESAIKSDPCYIFVCFMGDEAGASAYTDALLSGVGWSSLSAVREGRVIYLPKSLFHLKPNKLWADAYEYVINALSGEEMSCVH